MQFVHNRTGNSIILQAEAVPHIDKLNLLTLFAFHKTRPEERVKTTDISQKRYNVHNLIIYLYRSLIKSVKKP